MQCLCHAKVELDNGAMLLSVGLRQGLQVGLVIQKDFLFLFEFVLPMKSDRGNYPEP